MLFRKKGGGPPNIQEKHDENALPKKDVDSARVSALKSILSGRRSAKKTEKHEYPRFAIAPQKITAIQPGAKTATYPLLRPYAYANIVVDPKEGHMLYNVVEPQLSGDEQKFLAKLKDGLIQVIDVSLSAVKNSQSALELLEKHIQRLINDFRMTLTDDQYLRIMYYIYRDFVGLNELEPLLRDPYIEDISADGTGVPLYVVHQRFGQLQTNVAFKPDEYLKEFVVKLAERCDRYVSYAEPLLDGSLPDGTRVQASLAGDVTSHGPTFSIRKFREKPFTPIDQFNMKTSDLDMLAYLWFTVEHGANILICGGTATGKTSLLNSLAFFMPPESKVVSIEDSVLPGTEIIAEIDGRFTRSTIDELIDEALRTDKGVLEDGTEISRPQNIRIFSVNNDGKIELKQPSTLIRHKVRKPVLDVVLASGRKISVTKDHSLFTLKDCGISPIPGSDISVGTWIAVPRYLPMHPSNGTEFDIFDYPETFSECFVKSENVPEIMDANYVAFRENLTDSGIRYLKRAEHINLGLLDKTGFKLDDGKVYAKLSKYSIPSKLLIDKSAANVIGLWLADGCYAKNSIILSTDDAESRLKINEFAQTLGLEPKAHSDGISLMLNSQVLKKLFEGPLELRGNAYTKRFPEWIFDLPDELMVEVLRGYFSGDGCVKKNEASISSASLGLLHDVQTALLRFGILLRIPKDMKADKTYEARISGSKFLKTFKEKIGFNQDYKNRKLDECIRGQHDVSDVIPLSQAVLRGLRENLRKGGKKWVSAGNYTSGKSNVGREYLKGLLATLDSNDRLIQKLRSLSQNDIFWDRVIAIQERDYEGYVYDLSVPETENFVCANIVAHNTREININHENWIPAVARPGFAGTRVGEVTMFDLLKEAFRQNPNYLLVGEVRGEEASVMFQAMASGITSMSTMHAGSVEDALKRLQTRPISLPPTLLETLDIMIIMAHAVEKGASSRRIRDIIEIESVDAETSRVKYDVAHEWDAAKDDFRHKKDSFVLRNISKEKGIPIESITKELAQRKRVLSWLAKQPLDWKAVAEHIILYYRDRQKLLDMIEEPKPAKRR